MSAAGAPSPAVSNVLRALAAVQAPDTPQQQRAAAQQYCEQVKAQPQQCLEGRHTQHKATGRASGGTSDASTVSLSLLQLPPSSLGGPELAPAARHFALHALQHLVASGWNSLSDAEKTFLKQQVVGCVQNCTVLSGGVRFLKQTVARIVTEIALREWPQRWPNMLDVLFSACTQPAAADGSAATPVSSASAAADPAGTELLALIFRNLSEEATGSESATSSLPEQRRRDVQAGLMVYMDKVLPWTLSALSGAVQAFASNKADAQALRNCRALLEAMQAMLDFLPAKWVFELSLLRDTCNYLVHPDLFESLCEILSSVSSRKATTIDDAYGPQLVAVWDSALGWMQALMQGQAFPKQIDFTHKMLNVIANLTRLHADLLTPPKFDGVKAKLLTVLGQLFNHPNQKISFVALELWVHLMRHHAPSIIKGEYRQSLLSELLKLACVKLIKPVDPSPSSASSSADDGDADDGIESQEERNQSFGVYRGALLQLIALMASLEPLLCFQVVLARYQGLLALPRPDDALTPGPDGFVSMRTKRFLELEATGSLLECLFRSVGANKWEDASLGPQLRAQGEALLQLILSWSTTDPLLQTRRLHILGLCYPVMASNPSLLDATLQALLEGVAFRPPSSRGVAWEALSEDLKACRRRAIVSLIQLARRRKEIVEPFLLARFSALVARILELLAPSTPVDARISEQEKIALFEFLVLVAQALPPERRADQNNFLQSILQEPLALWTGAGLTGMLAYGAEVPQGQAPPFLQLLGCNPEEQATFSQPNLPPEHPTASRTQRRQIGNTLHTFMAIFKPLFGEKVAAGPGAAASGAGSAPGTPNPSASASSSATGHSDVANTAATTLLPLVLPNLLRLLGHLYALRNPALRGFIPAHMVAGLLAPTAEQVLHPEGASVAQSTLPPVTPRNFNLLWSVRHWVDKALDAGVHLMMLAAKSGSVDGFYLGLCQPPLSALYASTLWGNLAHMHVRELRLLLDKFLEALMGRCPPHMYLQVFMGQRAGGGGGGQGGGSDGALLPNILRMVQQRLEQGWAQTQAGKAAGPGASVSLSAEILEDAELRELSRCVSEHFSHIIETQYVSLHSAHTAATAALLATLNHREKDRVEKERRQQESQLLSQAPFCQLVFTQEPLLSSLYSLLLFLVSCPDSAASVRSIRLLHRLLPAATGGQGQGQGSLQTPRSIDLYAQVFQAGVRLLATAKAQQMEVVEMEMIALLKDIYSALVLPSLSLSPRSLLLSLPGPDVAQHVSVLESTLGTVCAEKKHRAAMRLFLDRHVKAARVAMQQAASTGAASVTTNPLDVVGAQKESNVRDLEPLALPARARPKVDDDEVPDIVGLFG